MSTLMRTMLYIPGNNPSMLQNASVFGADTVLFDLEDAVAVNQKDAARSLVKHMLDLEGLPLEKISIRVNAFSTSFFMSDLEAILPMKPGSIRIPKIETAKDVLDIVKVIEKFEQNLQLKNYKIKLQPLIESPLGVENAFEIAKCSDRIEAITVGGQDLTANMGIKKTKEGHELQYAKQRIVMAAKAAGILVLDTVFIDINDDEGLRRETEYSRDLGFDGKSVIHPRQIPIIHEVYKPLQAEVDFARRVVEKMGENKQMGIGVFAIDGRMVDAPVVKRAETLIKLAEIYGM